MVRGGALGVEIMTSSPKRDVISKNVDNFNPFPLVAMLELAWTSAACGIRLERFAFHGNVSSGWLFLFYERVLVF